MPDENREQYEARIFEEVRAQEESIKTEFDTWRADELARYEQNKHLAWVAPDSLSKFLATADAHEGAALSALPSADVIIENDIESLEAAQSAPKSVTINLSAPDEPWHILYGRVRTQGVITFLTTDLPNQGEWLHHVRTLAAHEVESVERIFINGVAVTTGNPATEQPFLIQYDGRSGTGTWGHNGSLTGAITETHIWSSFTKGIKGQAVNPHLDSQGSVLFPGMIDTNFRQDNHAYMYHIFFYDGVRYPTRGVPQCVYEVKGKLLYDPRVNTLAANYDALTKRWSDNAVLVIADYLCDTRLGYRVPLSEINWEQVKDAADLADENNASTLNLPRYTINGIVKKSETHRDVLRKLALSIGGEVVKISGKWHVYPATWRAPSITLTESDIKGSIKVKAALSKRDTYNAVKGTYQAADDAGNLLWEGAEYPVVKNTTYQSEDGEQLMATLDLSFVNSGISAQRLAKIYLEKNRQQIEVVLTVSISAYRLQFGDVVNLTLAHYGWPNKPFEVRRTRLVLNSSGGGPTYGVELTLRETASGVFDFNAGDETTVDLAPNTILLDQFFDSSGNVVAPDPPTNLVLESGTNHLFLRNDGTVFSSLHASWTASPSASLTEYQVQYKKTTDTDWQDWTAVLAPGTQVRILDVEDRVQYDVRVRASNDRGGSSAWLSSTQTVEGKTEPPTAPTNLAANFDSYGLKLTWDGVSDLDISHYRIFQDSALVGEVDATEFNFPSFLAGAFLFEVYSVDTSNNISLTAATLNTIVDAPNNVRQLSFHIDGPSAVLSWTEPAPGGQFAIEEYDIHVGDDFATSTKVSSVKGLTFSQFVTWEGIQKYWVVAKDIKGNTSGPVFVNVDITPPGAIRNLALEVVDNNVLFRYEPPDVGTLPIEEYEIYKGNYPTEAELVGTADATFETTFEFIGGEYEYSILARDTAGNKGPVTSRVVTVNEPPGFVIQDEQYRMVLTDNNVNADVRLDSNGRTCFWAPVNETETWEEHFQNNGFVTPQDQIDAGFPIYSQPVPLNGSYQFQVDYGVVFSGTLVIFDWTEVLVGGSVSVVSTLEHSLDGVTWTSLGSVKQAFVNNFRHLRVTLDITSDGKGIADICNLYLQLNLKRKTEAGRVQAASSDASGTQVTFKNNFIDVLSINLTPNIVSNSAATAIYDFVDVANPTDFSIYLFDSNGTRISGEVSYLVEGLGA